MKNNKWSVESFSDKPIHVVLFVSRNKDNEGVEGFKERRKSFITHKTGLELQDEFNDFVAHGVHGEMSRIYYSVNARDSQKIYTHLMHFLFDNPDFNLCSIAPKLAGIAAKKECALEKKWLFDFDIDDKCIVIGFTEDIIKFSNLTQQDIKTYKTPNGYAVVVEHGFDTRELMEKWGEEVTLKRDDLLFIDGKLKEMKF